MVLNKSLEVCHRNPFQRKIGVTVVTQMEWVSGLG